MNFFNKGNIWLIAILIVVSAQAQPKKAVENASADPASVFRNPPADAKPGVLWMWMGANLSMQGITKDLEALKGQGFNRTTMFSLADITTPWAGYIGKDPTPEIISWTEPWWKLVRHAAVESKRLGMDFGMFNGPSYTSSGGKWITPEMSMQEISWSDYATEGGQHVNITLRRPTVNPRANQSFPHHNPENGKLEKPEIEARKTYYKDIAILAVPATGIIPKDSIIDLTSKMQPDGTLEWDVPVGNWIIYRFGHTTRGTLIQPAQWEATGFEVDKISPEAMLFHMSHVVGEIKKHLGDLIGTGFTHVHFDSYEAGFPTWTPKMREEFLSRRKYDLLTYLPSFAKRIIISKDETSKFNRDFDATIKDLYRDVYFTTISKTLKEANLSFLCEPYGGPWRQEEVMPLISKVMTE
ncbi:MAG TPA: glycosyl hydrolase, partial [Segetibacter sp.]